MEHLIAKKLLTGKGENEISLFWADKETGNYLQINRPGQKQQNYIMDLKTTGSAKPEDFVKNAYKYGYHRQAYWYSYGYEQCFKEEPKGFVFIVVEKEPPYEVCVFEATELFKAVGKIEARKKSTDLQRVLR